MGEDCKQDKKYEFRLCPRCGAPLYVDIGVCYNCLFDFTADPLERLSGMPELDEPELDGTEPLDIAAHVIGTAGRGPGLWVRTESMDAFVPVPEEGITVGRDPACDLVLHDPAVSRRHLRVLRVGEGLGFVDLDATNPALYGGRPLVGSATLVPGEEVRVSGAVLTVSCPSR